MKQMLRCVVCALWVLAVSPFVHAQDRVVVAGQDGIAAPKRTRTVSPVYPQEAQAKGVRGIVILEILIDPQGKVASAEVIRSIPLLDEAALLAVRKWEYEVTKVGGQPVSVKLTVPITFALKLPEVTRAPGIPELRQGTSVAFPAGATEGGTVSAQVTLAPDGQVAEAEVVKGSAPFTVALLQALRTWRFAPDDETVILSFQAEATFVAPSKGDKGRVDVRLGSLRRSESMSAPSSRAAEARAEPAPDIAPPPPEPGPPSLSSPVAGGAPEPSVPAPAAAVPAPTVPPVLKPAAETVPVPAREPAPAAPGAPTIPAPTAPSAQAPTPAPAVPSVPAAALPAAPGPPAPVAARPGTPAVETKPGSAPSSTRPTTAAPPVEVLTAPPPPGASDANPAPALPGVSAVKDVTLALGVPDLVRGRRPVPPPLARMSGTTGSVLVKFGVDAAGATSVSEAEGPEALKTAATYTVQSWLFRRISVERLHLVASFDFAGETAKASIKPE